MIVNFQRFVFLAWPVYKCLASNGFGQEVISIEDCYSSSACGDDKTKCTAFNLACVPHNMDITISGKWFIRSWCRKARLSCDKPDLFTKKSQLWVDRMGTRVWATYRFLISQLIWTWNVMMYMINVQKKCHDSFEARKVDFK